MRPAADALYTSKTEPWSLFLTGKQGLAPKPDFDPLEYAIELCHSKGMELHAWFNPFRVRNKGFYPLDPKCFAAKNQSYLRTYDNKLFFDPGIPQVRSYLIKVIMEVVHNYDIDAIHLDDYFYPYPVTGKKFPDQKTFSKYGRKFYPNHLGDWRRDNINQFIRILHDSIRAAKPTVNLGVSPFGVWRNQKDDSEGSPGYKANTSYDDLYVDVYKWLSSNWIDYVIPQLYWEQGNRFGDFSVLAKWWDSHSFGKPLYLGQALFKSTGSDKVFTNPKEISQQISISRKFENVKGFALYSASHLFRLSADEINELNGNLLSTKVDTPNSSRSTVIAQNNTQILTETAIPDHSPKQSNENNLQDIKNPNFNSLINNNLPIPEQFKVIRSKIGWELSWVLPSTHPVNYLRYTIVVYGKDDKGNYEQKVVMKTDSKHIRIPYQPGYNPAKVLYGVASVGENGDQGPMSGLFKIRRRRVVYK